MTNGARVHAHTHIRAHTLICTHFVACAEMSVGIFPFLLGPPQLLTILCFFMVMIENTPWGPTKALHTVISDPQIMCLGQTLQAKEGQGFGTSSTEAGGTWQG